LEKSLPKIFLRSLKNLAPDTNIWVGLNKEADFEMLTDGWNPLRCC